MTWISTPETQAMGAVGGEKTKSFAAYTPAEARSAASRWLGNFHDHPPLKIRSIRVSEEHDLYIATVAYWEMTVEKAPRYFPNYGALPRSAVRP